jgi:hypothetical protein
LALLSQIGAVIEPVPYHVEVRTTVQVRETSGVRPFAAYRGPAAQAVLEYWQLKASADDSGDNFLPIAYLGATQSFPRFARKTDGASKKRYVREDARCELAFQ